MKRRNLILLLITISNLILFTPSSNINAASSHNEEITGTTKMQGPMSASSSTSSQVKERARTLSTNNFELADWKYEEKSMAADTETSATITDGKKQIIVLQHYNGNLKNIDIPGLIEEDGKLKEIWLDSTSWGKEILPMDVETVNFIAENGGKAPVIAQDRFTIFKDRSKLKNVDFSGLDLSLVTGLYETFKGCTSLESVSLVDKDTSKVTTMSSMFENCVNLKSVTLANLPTTSLEKSNRTFFNTPALKYVDLSQIDLSNLIIKNMTAFFTNTTEKTPLLVMAGERNYDILSQIDYAKERRTIPGPYFEPNGGTINGEKKRVNYFTSNVVKTPEDIGLAKFNQWLENLDVKRDGANFEGWEIIDGPKQPSSLLDFTDTVYKANWNLIKPNTTVDNTTFNPQAGKLTFAYVPTQFVLDGPQVLTESGKGVYPFVKKEGFDIGIYYMGEQRKWRV